VISEVSIDRLCFKITHCPTFPEACILWFRDAGRASQFRVLGRFSSFSQKSVLNFILRYAVSPKLRVEVDRRRFMQRVQALPPNFFIDIERLSPKEKQRVFAEFFGAGSLFEYLDPPTKRRILAKRFHPDAGGDPQAMRVINEVFDCLRAAPVTGA